MNTKEVPIRSLESEKTDILRKIKDRSQTAKIASAVAGAVLVALPISAKAEPLGIKLDNDYENTGNYGGNDQFNSGATKDRFKMTFLGFIDEMTSTIFGKEFRIKSGQDNSIIIEVLSKSAIANDCMPSNEPVTCFYIVNDDGTIKHTVSLSPGVIVDGQQKWSNCEIPDVVHPSKNKDEVKMVKSTGVSGVFRVLVKSTNYCVDKVKDTSENTGFETFLAPETQDLVALTFHKLVGDVNKTRFKARDTNGNLIGLNRNSDGTWIAVTPSQDKDDFPEQYPMAMIERETSDGRKVTLMMTYNPIGTNRILVLEKHPDWTPENPKWSEVSATVEAVYETDPGFVLDDDGDGVPNSVEEATGGCIGYTDADKVDVNADGKSDTCQVECENYANQFDGTLTPSDLLPCASDLGYESAGQLKDGSTIHYAGSAPILGGDGTIVAQSSSKLRYIHTTLVGTGDPELARDVDLPDGYSASIKVNSGTAHVTGFDFLNQPVEFTVTPESGLVDLGFSYGAEVGIEGSDIELTVGGEYKPCEVAACGNVNPEPPAAEPAQTVEYPATQAETAIQAEPPPAQVEVPTPQPEPVFVAEAPTSVAEPAPDVIQISPNDVAESPSETDTGTVVVPPADAFATNPDTQVFFDTAADTAVQSPDTPLASPDTSPDTAQDEAGQSNPESAQDTAQNSEANPGTDIGTDVSQPDEQIGSDATPAKDENGGGTDAPVQGEETRKPIPTDAPVSAGTNQLNKPAEKNGGGGCEMNPNNPSALNPFVALGAVFSAWALKRRERIQKALKE